MLDRMLKEIEEKMEKTVRVLEEDLRAVRTGRASTALVDGVKVPAYGTEMSLNQLATINTPDPVSLAIQPFDPKNVAAIEKALLAANLGMTPSNDGRVVRLRVPALTEETRREIVKKTHAMAEQARVAVRNLRRHANEDVKRTEKEHEIGEDQRQRFIDQVQKKTDAHIKKIDEVLARKEAEIMKV